MKGIIGRKRGMTQIYGPAGEIVPVTVIEAGPCPVVQVKTEAQDGYDALQLGFDELREKLVTKPIRGHFAKAGVSPRRKLRELRTEGIEEYQAGQEIRADIFEVGERVDVRGTSKGRGFSGGMKRWGFHGGKSSHGSKNHRQGGSIGQCATPARVWKGRKMAGQYGAKAITMRNLEVVQVDVEKNLLLLKGAVPGARNGFLFVHKRG